MKYDSEDEKDKNAVCHTLSIDLLVYVAQSEGNSSKLTFWSSFHRTRSGSSACKKSGHLFQEKLGSI